jgi:hypothetical protein
VQLEVDRVGDARDVARRVRGTLARLRRRFPDIDTYRVSIDAPLPGHRRRRRHRVRIGVVLHGSTARSGADGRPADPAHEEATLAIHDAFVAMRRHPEPDDR